VTVEHGSDPRTGVTRNSGLYAMIAKRHQLAGCIRPVYPRWERYWERIANRLRRPPAQQPLIDFHRRTKIVERELQAWEGSYDVMLQLQTIFAPGELDDRRPYCIYTDNTFTLTHRYYPSWFPLPEKSIGPWMALEGEVYRSAQTVFTTSEFARDAIVADYGCDERRVVNVGAGLNSEAVSPNEKDYRGQIALFVGIEFERKGGEVLLVAWREVQRQLPAAQLWIVGPQARSVAGLEHVRWLGYVRDRQLMADFYNQATLFVMPSLFEPLGLVFLEAMGHGLPCIGTQHCAMPEMIEHGTTGMLAPPRNPEALADALVMLLRDPERAATMGRRAHARVSNHWTWHNVVERMTPYLEQAAGQRKPTRSSSVVDTHLPQTLIADK
jgi:glycosyltransferase involved in cell wall biosynthesis